MVRKWGAIAALFAGDILIVAIAIALIVTHAVR